MNTQTNNIAPDITIDSVSVYRLYNNSFGGSINVKHPCGTVSVKLTNKHVQQLIALVDKTVIQMVSDITENSNNSLITHAKAGDGSKA